MRGIRFAGVAVCMALFVAVPRLSRAEAPAEAGAEPLKAKGLVKSGNSYVLAGEPEALEAMKALRDNKRKADRENALRKKAEDKIAANQKFIQDGIKEYKESEKKLPKIKDVNLHNRTVTRLNALAAKVKEAIESQKDLEEAANKVPNEARTKYVESLNTVAPKVEALAAKYKELAADPAVRAALDKANARSNPKVALGPSPDLGKAIDEVATWRSQLESEAIPLREYHGVYTVEAVVNGGDPLHMLLDTGASHVTLPFEVAEKLKLTPGENDPTVQMKLANGAIIEGKLMTVKTVKVGRFTVPNVSCVVLQQGLPDPPIILGTSFLNHFVVKLSQSARELYLTEVGDGGKADAK